MARAAAADVFVLCVGGVQDIQKALWVTIITGVAFAMIMGFVVLFLIRVFARCVVWTTIFGACACARSGVRPDARVQAL